MKSLARFLAFALILFPTSGLAAAESGVASLAFLSGHWRGTSTSGNVAEESISSAEGDIMLSTGREFADGKCVFYDLVVFTERAGTLTLIPHPNGKLSKDVFPATAVDASTKRAVFENPDHDFPKKFVYELVGPDHLRITLSGVLKGKPAEEIYDLKRTP